MVFKASCEPKNMPTLAGTQNNFLGRAELRLGCDLKNFPGRVEGARDSGQGGEAVASGRRRGQIRFSLKVMVSQRITS
jgi:hypothetical protein